MAKGNHAAMTITEEFAAKVKTDNKKERLMKWAPVFVLVGLVLVFTILLGKSFASPSNVVSILNQWAIPLLVALGLTFVIMIGSIDLSIDGTVGMAGALAAVLVMNSRNDNNMGIFGLILAILSSVFIGFIIGLIHVKLKIPSFMVSFAFMNICVGIGLLSYAGKPPTIKDTFIAGIAKSDFIGIPIITWIAIAVMFFCLYIQEYTPFGRHIYAVGTGADFNRNRINVPGTGCRCYRRNFTLRW